MNKNYKKLFLIPIIAGFMSINPAMADVSDAPAVRQKLPYEYETKIPVSKKEMALKFILAMAGVAASSIIIYVGLSVYNKIAYGSAKNPSKIAKSEDENYKTPNNMKDAIDIFLRKTK